MSPATLASQKAKLPEQCLPGVIDLSYRGLTCESIVKLAEDFQHDRPIVTLKLGFNELGDGGAKFIASFLRTNTTLTCLELGFCSIGDAGVESLASSLVQNASLRILYLSGNLVTAAGFKYLGTALKVNRSLSSLYLTGNAGLSEGAMHIAKGLQYNQSIEQLFINGNKIEKEGASSLADMLATNHNLTHLNVSDNNIGDEGLHSLSEAISKPKTIQVLELSFNKITFIGVNTFIDHVVGCKHLVRLLLDNNKLGCAGAKSLARVLPHLCLQDLNIAFNEIGSEGLLAVIAGVSACTALHTLVLSGNNIDEAVSVALAGLLGSPTALCALFLDHTNLSSHSEKVIGNGIANNKASHLTVLTGMSLGKALAELGSPAECARISNEQALRYLSQVWQQYKQSTQGRATETIPDEDSGAREGNAEDRTCQKSLVLALRKIVEQPFSSKDLQELCRYYFLPPQTVKDREDVASDESAESDDECSRKRHRHRQHHPPPSSDHTATAPHPNTACTTSLPSKRPTNRDTVSRITFYPSLKTRIETYRSAGKVPQALALLRQLKFAEGVMPNADASVIEQLLLSELG